LSFLEVKDLHVYFDSPEGRGKLRAVAGVSLEVERGESVGLVGESGCGKTTLGNAIMKLVPVTNGSITFDGTDTVELRRKELKEYRRNVQVIFQDPFGSLNPRLTIGSALSEVLKIHDWKPTGENESMAGRVRQLLEIVGLDPDYVSRYPHEFSGGQRQRVGIARALAVEPLLIVADEAVSALDVSVQVQILNLMHDLQVKMDLSYLFIAHDLAVVRYLCNRVLVMYLGRIVESANVDDLFDKPSHPYTEALLSAVPDVDKGLRARFAGSDRIVLRGDVPSPTDGIKGCPFHPRCHRAMDICKTEFPSSVEVSQGHSSVCHLAEEMFRA